METETPLPEREGHNLAFIHLPNNKAPLASVFDTHWIRNIECWFLHSDQDTFNEHKKYRLWVSSKREGHPLTIFGLLPIQTEINIHRTVLLQLHVQYLPKHCAGPLPKSLLQILSKISALTSHSFWWSYNQPTSRRPSGLNNRQSLSHLQQGKKDGKQSLAPFTEGYHKYTNSQSSQQ